MKKKLIFKKTTIANLRQIDLSKLIGGDGDNKTKLDTCACDNNHSILAPCQE